MKIFFIALSILFTISLILFFTVKTNTSSSPGFSQITPQISSIIQSPEDVQAVTVIAENLDTPWAIVFLPDNSMFVTERQGMVKRIGSDGKSIQIASIGDVKEIGEGGLLGITLHPDFPTNYFVYLYYTYNGSGNDTLNHVVRMTYQNDQLTEDKIIVDRIPGASNHNGGRIKFGPDKYLYIATGDAQEPSLAQDTGSLAGKILRVTEDGTAAPGNPFNNLVYSYGHRNPQGLTWDTNGVLWSTEHGPSGGKLGIGNDEVNRIDIGKNYGWPEIQGDQTSSEMQRPVTHSGKKTWAPAGVAFIGNSLFFGGLRGQSLYEFAINGDTTSVTSHFEGVYGRIREVILGPDGMLYITTSNRDGRGNPQGSDDRIIRVNPEKL